MGTPFGVPVFSLAAGVVAAVAANGVAGVAVAAAAEQNSQNDDPPDVEATATVVTAERVAHKNTSEKERFKRHRSFHGIQPLQKGARPQSNFNRTNPMWRRPLVVRRILASVWKFAALYREIATA